MNGYDFEPAGSSVTKHDLIDSRPQLPRHIDLIGTRIIRNSVQHITLLIHVLLVLDQ